MRFRNNEDLEKFLSDTAYYAGQDNYCLGDTLEEAGEIVGMIVKESEKNVELDS